MLTPPSPVLGRGSMLQCLREVWQQGAAQLRLGHLPEACGCSRDIGCPYFTAGRRSAMRGAYPAGPGHAAWLPASTRVPPDLRGQQHPCWGGSSARPRSPGEAQQPAPCLCNTAAATERASPACARPAGELVRGVGKSVRYHLCPAAQPAPRRQLGERCAWPLADPPACPAPSSSSPARSRWRWSPWLLPTTSP